MLQYALPVTQFGSKGPIGDYMLLFMMLMAYVVIRYDMAFFQFGAKFPAIKQVYFSIL